MKEYLLLIRENLNEYGKMTPEEMEADVLGHMNWVKELIAKGHFKGGNPLMPERKRVSTSEGLITDGPFADVKEGVSGYYFLLAESLEQAAEIARGCPSLKAGATLEITEVIPAG
ncbi:MAG: YciI family protein [Bacteroidia bacterium]|jgi:hypothetical protein|nr:YciI family protein [Bacteroidia bacterium]